VERATADIDCEQAQEEFSALLDSELSAEEQERVESHLAKCSACLRELSSVQHVQQTYRSQPLVSAPDKIKMIPIASSSKSAVRLSNNLSSHSTRSYRSLMTAGGMLAIVATIWLVMSSLYVPIEESVLEEPALQIENIPFEFVAPTGNSEGNISTEQPIETVENGEPAPLSTVGAEAPASQEESPGI
jgi:hypothetical protein